MSLYLVVMSDLMSHNSTFYLLVTAMQSGSGSHLSLLSYAPSANGPPMFNIYFGKCHSAGHRHLCCKGVWFFKFTSVCHRVYHMWAKAGPHLQQSEHLPASGACRMNRMTTVALGMTCPPFPLIPHPTPTLPLSVTMCYMYMYHETELCTMN